MKFHVTMKDPDVLNDAIEAAVEAELKAIEELTEDDREALRELRAEAARKVANKWFEYDEYLTVEIDTEAGTCVAIPR